MLVCLKGFKDIFKVLFSDFFRSNKQLESYFSLELCASLYIIIIFFLPPHCFTTVVWGLC